MSLVIMPLCSAENYVENMKKRCVIGHYAIMQCRKGVPLVICHYEKKRCVIGHYAIMQCRKLLIVEVLYALVL